MENKNFMIFSLLMIIFTLFQLLLFTFNIQSIYAHTEIKVGNYTIEAGWDKELPLLNNCIY
jgi:hypothetical protein